MSFGVFVVAILILFCKKTLFNFGVIAKECRSLFYVTSRWKFCNYAMPQLLRRDEKNAIT